MKTLVFALCAIFVVLMGTAYAAPLFYEGFDYAAGSAIPSTGGWTNSYGTGFTVTSEGGTYTDGDGNAMQVSGNAAYINMDGQWSGSAIALPQSVTDLFAQNGTIYASFLIKEYAGLAFVANSGLSSQILVNAYSGLMTTDYFNMSTEVQLNVWPSNVNRDATTGSQFYWNGTEWALWTMRIVMQDGADEITLLRNPNLSGGVDWDTGFTAMNPGGQYEYGRRADGVKMALLDVTSADFSQLRITSAGGVPAWAGGPLYKGGVDEIRIGTSWGDVAPVPEPSSILALVMGAAGFGGFAIRRRRA